MDYCVSMQILSNISGVLCVCVVRTLEESGKVLRWLQEQDPWAGMSPQR